MAAALAPLAGRHVRNAKLTLESGRRNFSAAHALPGETA
jgi:hypothetical protein